MAGAFSRKASGISCDLTAFRKIKEHRANAVETPLGVIFWKCTVDTSFATQDTVENLKQKLVSPSMVTIHTKTKTRFDVGWFSGQFLRIFVVVVVVVKLSLA